MGRHGRREERSPEARGRLLPDGGDAVRPSEERGGVPEPDIRVDEVERSTEVAVDNVNWSKYRMDWSDSHGVRLQKIEGFVNAMIDRLEGKS